MPIPKSVTKTKASKTGKVEVSYTSNVDQVNYTITELIRRANIDVGMFIAKQCNATARTLFRGVNKTRRIGTRVKVAAFQYWARKQENDLIVGIKHDTWYGARQELGDHGMVKHGVLYSTVRDNITQIRDIQGQYLSAINEANRALRLAEDAENMPDTAND